MIVISTESTSDLDHLQKQLSVPVLPLYVELDEESFLDGQTISAEKIFSVYEQKKLLPKTAARSIDDYIEFFDGIKKSGADQIVHVSLSGEISASYNNARLAAAETDGVFVVDSRSLSSGVGLLVLKGMDFVKSGLKAQEIAQKLNELVPKVQASFVVDTMEYLHKGGRCSGVAKLIAGVLKIKPMLALKDGKIIVAHKFMGTHAKSIEKYVDGVLQKYNTPDYSRIFITHSHANPQLVQAVKDQIKAQAPNFKEIIETVAGCTITAHCGKSTLGILYINCGE